MFDNQITLEWCKRIYVTEIRKDVMKNATSATSNHKLEEDRPRMS